MNRILGIRPGLLITLLTFVAAILRFLWLGSSSLWIDELFSVSWADMPLADLLGSGARIETNPPGYYVLLHLWMMVFGKAEIAVRALSALASSATVPVVYALGAGLFEKRTAFIAALLTVINPVAISYAQEARSYALLTLTDSVGLLAIVGCFREHAKGDGRALAWHGLFIVSMVAACWLHYTSLLFVAGCFVAVSYLLLQHRPFQPREVAAWLASWLIITLAVSWLVWLAALLFGSNNLVWVPPLSWESVLSFFLGLTVPAPQAPEIMPFLLGISALMVLIVAMPGCQRLALRRLGTGVLLIPPAVYCALLVGISAIRPMLLSRTAVWLIIPLCLLLGRGVMASPSRWRPVAGLIPILTFLACSLQSFRSSEAESWREASRLVGMDPRCQGPLLIGGFNALGFHYYPLPTGRAAYVFLPDPRRRNSVEFRLSTQLMHLPELPMNATPEFIRQHRGTSVVYRDEYEDIIANQLNAVSPPPVLRKNLGGLEIVCF
jgi:mannosyltransferase